MSNNIIIVFFFFLLFVGDIAKEKKDTFGYLNIVGMVYIFLKFYFVI